MLFQYQNHLSALIKEIDVQAQDFKDYKLIQSIPGIGKKIAATIISEIGDIHHFHHVKQVTAYAVLDPSVFGTGGNDRLR